MNTARSSGESLSAIGNGEYGIEPQLPDVVLIAVSFMFSGLTQALFFPRAVPNWEAAACLDSLIVFQINAIWDHFIDYSLHLYDNK